VPQLAGAPRVLGSLVSIRHPPGRRLPGVAQVAAAPATRPLVTPSGVRVVYVAPPFSGEWTTLASCGSNYTSFFSFFPTLDVAAGVAGPYYK
jgi:hypothetical protein